MWLTNVKVQREERIADARKTRKARETRETHETRKAHVTYTPDKPIIITFTTAEWNVLLTHAKGLNESHHNTDIVVLNLVDELKNKIKAATIASDGELT